MDKRYMYLRNAAIVVLLIGVFFVAYPPIFMSIYETGTGRTFWDSFQDNTYDGMRVDLLIYMGMVLYILLRGRSTDYRLSMVFGGSRKHFYKEKIKQVIGTGIILSFIRCIIFLMFDSGFRRLFVTENNQTEIEYVSRLMREHPDWDDLIIPEQVNVTRFVYDSGDSHVSYIYLFICSFMLFVMMQLSVEILFDIFPTHKKLEMVRKEETLSATVLRLLRNTFRFLFIISIWIMSYVPIYFVDTSYRPLLDEVDFGDGSLRLFYNGYGGIQNLGEYINSNYFWFRELRPEGKLFAIIDMPLEIILPNGNHMSLGYIGAWVTVILIIIMLLITLKMYRKVVLKKQDWIDL